MTMTMSPAKVLEHQAELLTRLRTNELMRRFVFGVLNRQIGIGSPFSREMVAQQAALAFEHLEHSVRGGEAYHVSAEMTQVLQAMAAGLDDTDHFDIRHAPSGAGIVRFDGGLRCNDVRGNAMIIDWIVWGTSVFQVTEEDKMFERPDGVGAVASGVCWYEFNDAHDNADGISEQIPNGERLYGRWGFAGQNIATDGQRIGPPEVNPTSEQSARVYAAGDHTVPATNTVRLIHAFWLMLQQQITVTSRARPHKSVQPALKKARLPKNREVTVVELRKHRYVRDDEDSETRRIEWDHRWLVRGFWRWQVCGEGRKDRKRIWIHEHIKGPADRPLVIKNRVSDLRR